MLGEHLNVRVYAACDSSVQCQSVLLAHQGLTAAEHVFGPIEDRLRYPTRQRINRVTEQHEAKVESMAHELVEDGCMTFEKAKVRACNEIGPKYKAEIVKILAREDLSNSSWCVRHKAFCPVRPPVAANTVIILLAGVDCTPWSERGSRHKWMKSQCTISLLTLAKEMCTLGPDVAIIECSAKLPTDALTDTFDAHNLERTGESKHQYKEERVAFDNFELGLAAARYRGYTAITNIGRVTATMPFNYKNFMRMAAREFKFNNNGQGLFTAAPSDVQASEQKRFKAAPKRNKADDDLARLAVPGDTMSAKTRERLGEFLKELENMPGVTPVIDL